MRVRVRVCVCAEQTEAELKGFSPHFRRQYCVALCSKLQQELEQHNTSPALLLKQRVRKQKHTHNNDPTHAHKWHTDTNTRTHTHTYSGTHTQREKPLV